MPSLFLLLAIGIAAGIAAGLFGIGGGLIIVPALVYWADFSQHRATGTSLAVLLPPIGLAATYEYYRRGQVDVRAALIMAAAVLAGSWIGALGANRLKGPQLRLVFGLFLCAVGIYMVVEAWKRLGTLE